MRDIVIDTFLSQLGLTGDSAALGRAVLEEAGITNPRKTRISEAKVARARAVIDSRLARFCSDCASRTDAGGREIALVPPSACTRCGGSRNDRALTEMREACAAVGIERVVIVGGSPDVRRELSALWPPPELRLVDGTARRTKPEALRDLDWADLVVIAGSSELAHKVSTLYTRERGGTPVVTSTRRGVEAIAAAVVEHATRR